MPDTALSAGETLSAVGQSATLGVSGFGGIAFQIQGTFDGTLTFEASVGSEWQEMRVTASDSSSPVTSTTDPGIYIGSAVGFTAVRARMTVRNSGAAYVLIRADVPSPGGAGGGGGAGSNVNLIEVGGESIQLGETTMDNSIPVVIASNQTPIPITGSITANNNAAGPVGDPIPTDASSTAYEDPSGDLATFKLEDFDFDTGAGSDPTTAIGLKIPGNGGGVAVGAANPLPVSAASLPLPTGAATLAEQQTQTTALSAIQTAVQIMEDWDESDRAKVNPIVGQAGVQGGAGAVSATTQRVVLATDTTVPNVTGNVAADAGDSGNPVKIGYKAFSPDGTTAGAVAEADRSDAKSDLNGRLFTNSVAPTTVKAHFDGSSAYTDQQIAAAPGSGKQTIITFISFSTGAATACNLFLEEGSTKIFGPIYLEAVAGRGYVSGPIYLPVTANTAVTFTTSAAIAQSVDFQYFIQDV